MKLILIELCAGNGPHSRAGTALHLTAHLVLSKNCMLLFVIKTTLSFSLRFLEFFLFAKPYWPYIPLFICAFVNGTVPKSVLL